MSLEPETLTTLSTTVIAVVKIVMDHKEKRELRAQNLHLQKRKRQLENRVIKAAKKNK